MKCDSTRLDIGIACSGGQHYDEGGGRRTAVTAQCYQKLPRPYAVLIAMGENVGIVLRGQFAINVKV